MIKKCKYAQCRVEILIIADSLIIIIMFFNHLSKTENLICVTWLICVKILNLISTIAEIKIEKKWVSGCHFAVK